MSFRKRVGLLSVEEARRLNEAVKHQQYEEYRQECIDSGDRGHILPFSEWEKGMAI